MTDEQKEFLNQVKSRKRVFGSPSLIYSDLLYLLREEEKEYNKKFKAGDFFIGSKEIAEKRAKITKKKKIIESVSGYLLKLLNNVNDPVWNNAFLFSNVIFDPNHMRLIKVQAPDKTVDEFEVESKSSVVNMEELNNILNKSVVKKEEGVQLYQLGENIYEEIPEYAPIDEMTGAKPLMPYVLMDYILQMREITIAIKIHQVNTSPEIPICVFDNIVMDPSGKPLFELTPKMGKDIFSIDVIYNKTGALVFKNVHWENGTSRLVHITDLKNFIEKEIKGREQMEFKERFSKLSEFYEVVYKPKLTEFSENVEIMKKDLNLK